MILIADATFLTTVGDRVAIGPQKGRKVFTLQAIPPKPEPSQDNARVTKLNGFSLHAGVAAQAHQRKKLERLCRYIARPAIAEKRHSMTSTGKVRYELKTPFRNGILMSSSSHWISLPGWPPWCPNHE